LRHRGVVPGAGVDGDRSILDDAFENKLEVGVVQLCLPFRVQQIETSVEVDTDDDHGRVAPKRSSARCRARHGESCHK